MMGHLFCGYALISNDCVLIFVQRSLLQLFERPTELVRTGSALGAAADAVDFPHDVIDVLTANQLADALQVAVAAAEEEYLLDDVVLVGGDVNHH